MRDSLKKIMCECIADFPDDEYGTNKEKMAERCDWLLRWPEQISLTCNCILWTQKVEEALTTSYGLQEMYDHEMVKLGKIVEVIKQPGISTRQRISLGTLVILDVHGKDVITELIEQKTQEIDDFQWNAQLRYYLSPPTEEKRITQVVLKMINTVRNYGYEYIGNQPRLVVTPLTDRCYRTLMSALHLHLGGCPQGPAGTGKTETCKDLAKANAKQIMVFNCSESLDVEAMGKFFKGIACCEAWACFDEFNRIEIGVLSVIAAQIHTIQTAIIKKYKDFEFDDILLKLDPTCAIFVTMNPNYTGRSELPDNLKSKFRPVAMMIPNFVMISEIMLYSFGFNDAKLLAIKIVTALHLASEQLSTQGHYDYGMRAVKSIISTAGSLKQIQPDEPESNLVLRAISDCNLPKFVAADIPLFEAIMADLFPKIKIQKPNYGILVQSIKWALEFLRLEESEDVMTKLFQLYDTLQVRHGIMIVGENMTGKSSIVRTLSIAISMAGSGMTKEEIFEFINIKYVNKLCSYSAYKEDVLHTLEILRKKLQQQKKPYVNTYPVNPKAVTIGQLYGENDKISQDWHDGILPTIIRSA